MGMIRTHNNNSLDYLRALAWYSKELTRWQEYNKIPMRDHICYLKGLLNVNQESLMS